MENANNAGFRSNARTILIVEDDDSIRKLLQQYLQMEGYSVSTAGNGREALDKLIEDGDRLLPGLILLDLMMPIMDGWQFLETIAEHDRLSTLPIVVITAFDERAQNIGRHPVIKKPIDLDVLMQVVRNHCQ